MIKKGRTFLSDSFMSAKCSSGCDGSIFQFGGHHANVSVVEAGPKSNMFVEAVPNPFNMINTPGDSHTPYSAPLWFERDPKTEEWVGKSLPPFWWKSRFPQRTPESPATLGFQGHSTLR